MCLLWNEDVGVYVLMWASVDTLAYVTLTALPQAKKVLLL